MGNGFRRIILKPSDLDDATAAQLFRALSAAVDAQRALAARSPHVLRFVGDLKEDDRAYYVEHEAAASLIDPAAIFQTSESVTEGAQLLRLTAATFDALKAVHASDAPLRAHGGICPGVLLTTPDGIEKITDFGFAPAVCAVLGPDRYVNLALATTSSVEADATVTGAWEILPADEYERDDRLCAFIDPEKYRTQAMTGFEPGSDVIAAGFVLHLLAERAHPYLPDPDAHRMVEMAELMPQSRYNGARRAELRKSPDRGVQVWCDLVARMLANLPQERPSAAEVCEALSAFVKPIDAAELLNRQLEAIDQRIRSTAPAEINWPNERAAVAALAEDPATPPEVVQNAAALLERIDAQLLIEQLQTQLAGDEWPAAADSLERLRAMRNLPPALAQATRKHGERFESFRAFSTTLDELRRGAQRPPDDPLAAEQHLNDLLARLEQLTEPKNGPPALGEHRRQTAESLQAALAQARQAAADLQRRQREEAERLEQERADDAEAAAAWLADLQSAADAGEWDMLGELLSAPPTLKHWPPGAEKQAQALRQRREDHIAEQQRLAQIEADHKAAVSWYAEVRSAVDSQNWDQTEALLEDAPKLTHWPDDFQQLQGEVETQLRSARKKQADEDAAHAWITGIRHAVENEKWAPAADALKQRPALDHWPTEVLEEEALYKNEVSQRLEAIERQRRRMAEDRTKAETWLKDAAALVAQSSYEEAIAALQAPPQLEHFPDDILTQSQQRLAEARQQLEHQRTERRAAAAAAVTQFAAGLVAGVVKEHLASLIAPMLVESSAKNVAFADEESLAQGTAELTVAIKTEGTARDATAWHQTFTFETHKKTLRLVEKSGEWQAPLIAYLREHVGALQSERLARLLAPLRAGLFPDAQFSGKPEFPREKLSAGIQLLGPKAKTGTIDCDLAWKPAALEWSFADAPGFARRAADVALAALRDQFPAAWLEESPFLKRYAARLTCQLQPPDLTDPAQFARPLALHALLVLRAPDAPQPLAETRATITLTTVGKWSLGAEPEEIEGPLRRAIAAAQAEAVAAIERDLLRQIKSAPVKAKLAFDPARITEPVDQIAMKLQVRRRDPLAISATWQPSELVFAMADGWQDKLAALLAPPAPGEARRGLMVPIAVAASLVVVLAGGGYVVLRGNGTQPDNTPRDPVVITTPNDNAQPGPDDSPEPPTDDRLASANVNDNIANAANDNSATPTDVITSPTDNGPDQPPADTGLPKPPVLTAVDFEPVRHQLKDALARSSRLNPADIEKLVTLTPAPDGTTATIGYTIPGLAGAAREFTLTADPGGQPPELPEESSTQIEQDVTALDALLNIPNRTALLTPLQNLVAQSVYAPLVDPQRLTWTLEPSPRWELEPNGWYAAGVACSVAIPAQGERPAIPLATIQLGLEATDGEVHVVSAPEDSVNQLLRAMRTPLIELQAAGLAAVQAETQQALSPGSDNVSVKLASPPDPNRIPEPELEAELEVTWDLLAPRYITARWSPETFSFTLRDNPAAASILDEMLKTADLLETIDRLINVQHARTPHWLRQVTLEPIFEISPPNDREWVLGVRAPWAPSGDTARFNPDERLPMVVPADKIERRLDVARVAQTIVNDALKRPDYWPLVDAFRLYSQMSDPWVGHDLKDNNWEDFGEAADRNNPNRSPFLDAVPDFVDQPTVIRPDLLMTSARPRMQLAGSLPDRIELDVVGGWYIDTAAPNFPAGLSPERLNVLRARLQPLISAPPAVMEIRPDGDKLKYTWRNVDQNVTAFQQSFAKVAALDEQLRRYAARAQLDAAVDTLMRRDQDSTTLAPGDAAAANLLRIMWQAKGITESPDTLQSASEDIQEKHETDRDNQLMPTIAIECACGVDFAYALVWSIGHGKVTAPESRRKVMEGPTLLRIADTARLHAPLSPADRSALATQLLDRALAAVPQAITAIPQRFRNAVGVAVGLDGPFLLLAEPIQQVTFSQKSSPLAALDPAQSPGAPRQTWRSLADLERLRTQDGRVTGYWVLGSLWDDSDIRPSLSEDQRWAFESLFAPP